ncbi:5'-nucleotidase [Alkalilimnicola sp. S0819]|uniref:5'-nucleotidase n=1 Tax=Alkalilimnicola sp. S0819 TaxID=2613922 RepID=UPI001261C42C|nr:5'-nucleotidase [Alkalilimnicola sp. S0819]KAB7627526.1 5'-nucleotidase [Alkalilimnicola sp. S0819]MPQ15680.1 5'-nucleotidase [Alkalilimnicola sp. S0819]
MPVTFDNTLVIAISSRALFDMSESHRVYTEEGVEAYCRYQIEHEDQLLAPGVAYGLVRKLLALNDEQDRTKVEVILLSRNSADTGLRVFNSVAHYGLNITRAAFTNGLSPYRYVPAFGAHLFLSADPDDVVEALNHGQAAATILPSAARHDGDDECEDVELRIAFDGDAVVFSDEAERVFRSKGLQEFASTERAQAREPLQGGPFKSFLAALHALQSQYDARSCPIRTALVTARGAPAHERVIRTLREWQVRIDEALFLGGLPKAEFLEAFGADIFFDDQQGHCELASRHVATGHVPHGVANEETMAGF